MGEGSRYLAQILIVGVKLGNNLENVLKTNQLHVSCFTERHKIPQICTVPYVFLYCTMSNRTNSPYNSTQEHGQHQGCPRKIVVKLAHLRPSRFQRRSGTGAGPLFGKIARGKFSQVSWTEPAGTRVALYIVCISLYWLPSKHQLVVPWKNSHKSHPLKMHQNAVSKESCDGWSPSHEFYLD